MDDKALLEYVAEVMVTAVCSIADDYEDDEPVPIGLVLRELADALDITDPVVRRRVDERLQSVEDTWVLAGEVRRRLRAYLAALASGRAFD